MGLEKITSLCASIPSPRTAINKLIDFKSYVSKLDPEAKTAIQVGATLLSSVVGGVTLCVYSQPWLAVGLVITGLGLSVFQLVLSEEEK